MTSPVEQPKYPTCDRRLAPNSPFALPSGYFELHPVYVGKRLQTNGNYYFSSDFIDAHSLGVS